MVASKGPGSSPKSVVYQRVLQFVQKVMADPGTKGKTFKERSVLDKAEHRDMVNTMATYYMQTEQLRQL
jgi:hypothetical protein